MSVIKKTHKLIKLDIVYIFFLFIRWLRIAQEYNEGIHCVLIGNKCDDDLKRMVPKCEAQVWAKEQNIEYYEVSAKEGTNIEIVFHHLARTLCDLKEEKKEKK